MKKLAAMFVLSMLLTGALRAADHRLSDKLEISRGICVVLGKDEQGLVLDLARKSELTIVTQLTDPDEVQTLRTATQKAGLYGTRVYVDGGTTDRIHLADNLADGLIVVGEVKVSKDEVMRVLRPGAKALVGSQEWVKPKPAGVDDWTHPYHGPDNNPQSQDQLATTPYLTQFIVPPRYAPSPQCAVAANGRVFMAFGHVAWHQREEPMLNTLMAMNGYNGTVLWTMELSPGIMVDRNTMIATDDLLYVGDESSCKVIDAATGKVKRQISFSSPTTDGTFWKWMALEGDTLYAVVGAAETKDPDATWKMNTHGWPWPKISRGYNAQQYEWGFGRTLLAVDTKTGKLLWHHRENEPIDTRATCMSAGRIYISSFGKYIACIDARKGKPVWRRTIEKDPAVFDAIGAYRPGHGWIEGWKSTMYLKCTEQGLYFAGPQTEWLTALSARDGHVMWNFPKKDVQILIRPEGLYTVGPQGAQDRSFRLDPLTGEKLKTYWYYRRACTRVTGTIDSILFRAGEGTSRLDPIHRDRPVIMSPMRPSCHTGVVIANGHLYWLPWTCDCNLQIFGVVAAAGAGDFQFNVTATEEERLESSGQARTPAKFVVAPGDWPTYRGDNQRAAVTTVAVPTRVSKRWEFTPKTTVEPTAPVSAGGLTFIAGSDGIVHALDTAGGKEVWTAFTGGAVRFPPTVADGRVFVGSGDGWAYAFEAATGKLLWRFRAAPVERKIPVFESLLSNWPVASGVLVQDGVAYLAAGINNFDGTYVYALDAATGKIRWQNNSSGRIDPNAGTGTAVQGALLLHEGRLYLAGGNFASPGIYDITDGKCLNPQLRGLSTQGPRGRELSLIDGKVEVTDQPFYTHRDLPVFDKKIIETQTSVTTANLVLICALPPKTTQWLLSARDPQTKDTVWSQPLPERPVPWGLAVDSQGRIIVTLYDGRVLCFN